MSNEPTSTGPVVVGVDGSSNARRALDVAARLARATGAEVVAVHALGLMATIGGEHVPSSEHRGEIERELRDEWCAPLSGPGAPAWRCTVVDGSPAEALLHAAEREHASFVVVGSRGVGGHPDLMLGSTSHMVIQRTHCPAIVVPPADRGPLS
jgi:nucleotide-binding universal stress UspA family protein